MCDRALPLWMNSPKQAVTGQPVVVVIHASADFLAYRGGIFTGRCSGFPNDGNFTVLVVGFTPTYWTVRTDLGPSFGEGGYARLAMNENTCGITNWGSYPLSNCESHTTHRPPGSHFGFNLPYATFCREVCMLGVCVRARGW